MSTIYPTPPQAIRLEDAAAALARYGRRELAASHDHFATAYRPCKCEACAEATRAKLAAKVREAVDDNLRAHGLRLADVFEAPDGAAGGRS